MAFSVKGATKSRLRNSLKAREAIIRRRIGKEPGPPGRRSPKDFFREILPKPVWQVAKGFHNLPYYLHAKVANPFLCLRRGTSDIEVYKKVFIQREYEMDYPASPGLIIDAGANVGYASVFYARMFPDAKIIAIEPDRSNFEALRKNTRGFPNILPVLAGLWSKHCRLEIFDPGSGKWGLMTRETDGDRDGIPGVTMDEILAQSGRPFIDILKMDVEGAEKNIFSDNNLDWLSRTNMIIIELHEWQTPGCYESFNSAVAGHRFVRRVKGENLILQKKSPSSGS